MASSFTEQRRQSRRRLEQSVSFYSNGNWELRTHAVGRTRNVSTQGMCIRTSRDHMPEADASLTILLIPLTESSLIASDTAIRIKGRVAWINRDTGQFGVCFT
ncbi:PilZ domain-containing protein [Desulfospira joergensenii]|uniref:PilZ domain-containing protein n=1 Tax=Desulfospira joergensenii TaxID=53329 RepID=UPI000A061C27